MEKLFLIILVIVVIMGAILVQHLEFQLFMLQEQNDSVSIMIDDNWGVWVRGCKTDFDAPIPPDVRFIMKAEVKHCQCGFVYELVHQLNGGWGDGNSLYQYLWCCSPIFCPEE